MNDPEIAFQLAWAALGAGGIAAIYLGLQARRHAARRKDGRR